jgi:hypothetical protein
MSKTSKYEFRPRIPKLSPEEMKTAISRYRSMELLDTIFTAVYPQELWVDDLENVHKMYKACHELLNAPEKPWQEYEKYMKKFHKCLNKYVAEMNQLIGGQK